MLWPYPADHVLRSLQRLNGAHDGDLNDAIVLAATRDEHPDGEFSVPFPSWRCLHKRWSLLPTDLRMPQTGSCFKYQADDTTCGSSIGA